MALPAYLYLSGTGPERPIPIIEYDLGFYQDLDVTGKPCSRPKGGLIDIVISSHDSLPITAWMLSPIGLKDGKIEFITPPFGKKRTVEFEEAVCVKYREVYDRVESSRALNVYFTISANRIKIGEAGFEHDWKNLPK